MSNKERLIIAFVLRDLGVKVPDRVLAEKILEAKAIVNLQANADQQPAPMPVVRDN